MFFGFRKKAAPPITESKGKGGPCVTFEMEDPAAAYGHLMAQKRIITRYGSKSDGKTLHTWDDGERILCRCRLCGGCFLLQESEYHNYSGGDDHYYSSFFPVSGPEEAEKINREWDGFQIERLFPARYLVQDNLGAPHWMGPEREAGPEGKRNKINRFAAYLIQENRTSAYVMTDEENYCSFLDFFDKPFVLFDSEGRAMITEISSTLWEFDRRAKDLYRKLPCSNAKSDPPKGICNPGDLVMLDLYSDAMMYAPEWWWCLPGTVRLLWDFEIKMETMDIVYTNRLRTYSDGFVKTFYQWEKTDHFFADRDFSPEELSDQK